MKIGFGCVGAVLLLAAVWAMPVPAADETTSLDTVTPSGITVQRRHDGILFADSDGMTLYTYEEDAATPGTSSCTRERHCERRWPPLPAPEGVDPIGNWSVILRHDGTPQWAYKGMPVYRSMDDLTPGVMSGDNANQVWHALFQPFPPPTVSMPPGFQVDRHGEDWVFTDHQGRHMFTPEGSPDSAVASCGVECLRSWSPVRAPMLARPVGDWSIEIREDGSRQWVYAGRPAYLPRSSDGKGGVGAEAGWAYLGVVEEQSLTRLTASD